MLDPQTKLIAIVGPTASGKTALANRLGARFNGEIVCADSRTIYRGMDIGTAKPTVAEQAAVPHHLLDVIEPDQALSAAEFKYLAEAAITDIASRGRVPFLVGGSGLYAYGVIYDYRFPAGLANVLREELNAASLPDLVARLEREDPEIAEQIDLKNRRRVVRALETVGQPRVKTAELPPNILLLGLHPSEMTLNTQIIQRTKTMIQIGLVDEVRGLAAKYSTDIEALKSPGYAEILSYLAGDISLEQTEELINLHTRQLVKRQLTWYRRNPEIRWIDDPTQAESAVAEFLASERV